MKQIGSPNLVFEPENDTDDYTLVTAYINEEYARVKDEEGYHRSDNGVEEKNVVENVVENVAVNMSSAAKAIVAGYSRKKQTWQ